MLVKSYQNGQDRGSGAQADRKAITTQASPGSGYFPQAAGHMEQLLLSSQRPSSQTEPKERKKMNTKQNISLRPTEISSTINFLNGTKSKLVLNWLLVLSLSLTWFLLLLWVTRKLTTKFIVHF